MTLDVAGVLRDAWVMAKRDRDIVVALAGLFIFVPQFAFLLLVPVLKLAVSADADLAARQADAAAMQVWVSTYWPFMLALIVLPVIAQISITLLYVDPAQPAVGAALKRAPLLFFPAFLAILIATPLGTTLQLAPLLIVPAAYLEGRMKLTMPILLGERPISVVRAIATSWRRTAGQGLAIGGLSCLTVIGGYLVFRLFMLLGQMLNGAPLQNPAVAALLDGGAALGATLGAVATIFVQVALYRRLSKGI